MVRVTKGAVAQSHPPRREYLHAIISVAVSTALLIPSQPKIQSQSRHVTEPVRDVRRDSSISTCCHACQPCPAAHAHTAQPETGETQMCV